MPKKLVSLLTLPLASVALLVAVPTAAQASPQLESHCRYPYTLSVGGVTWTVQPCIDYYDYSSVGGQPEVWADVDAWNGSTDVDLSAEVGRQQCLMRCGAVNWQSSTKTWFLTYPGNVYTNQLYSSPVPPVSDFCYYAKTTMLDSSIGEVGDVESPSMCF
ncbi:hypothetical protein [Actinoallomurus sp. CA-150999]|uniref:hypothetical protein n=1 Tax=Actinoallomurus sp. CA-150999 TaxID=3239887 RepID=UPI003D8D86A2